MIRSLLLVSALLAAPAATAQQGEAVFGKYCSGCHDHPDGRIPPRDTLKAMSPQRILRTLDFGLMMSIAYPLKREDRVAIDYNGHSAWGSVWQVPGQPDGAIALSMGFGRTRVGRAGNGAGFDVYPLRAASSPYFAKGAKVTKLGETFRLAAVQHHFAMEGRNPVHSGTLDEFKNDPYFSQRQSETPPKGLTILPETFPTAPSGASRSRARCAPSRFCSASTSRRRGSIRANPPTSPPS